MKDCVFCNIISKNLKSNIIHENKGAIVIMSDNPEVEGHMLVFAKNHTPIEYRNMVLKNIFNHIF